jgi:hypothetical protein
MKRFLLLLAATAAALVVVLPATAGAASFRGVVIAKDSARRSLVTASRDGTVRTVRLRVGFRLIGLGAVVVVRGSKLRDGTYSATRLRRTGKSRHAHVRATVVKRLGARLALSAGGSVFAVRVGGKDGASAQEALRAGDRVEGTADVGRGGLRAGANGLVKVGHDGQLVLEGIYLATAEDGTIELAVVHRGRVFVHVPEGMEVPAFEPGDEIALLVTVEADGSFTLVRAEDEDGGGEEISVAGILASVSADQVAVRVEEHAQPVRCDVPEGFELTGFEAGQRVYMTCELNDGRYVLVELRRKETPPPPGELVAEGTISELDAGHVGVAVDGHAEPIRCALPSGTNLVGFALGDEVRMTCRENDYGAFVLKTLVSDHASFSPDGSWFAFEGAISALGPTAIGVAVEGRELPVTCAVAPGADLSAFSPGDEVRMKCKLIGGVFTLKLLDSETAHYELI